MNLPSSVNFPSTTLSCTPQFISSLTISLLSNPSSHFTTSTGCKVTTFLNILQSVSDCHAESTNQSKSSAYDPNRERVGLVLDCFKEITATGFVVDEFLQNSDLELDFPIPFLTPGTRHAPPSDLNPTDSIPITITKARNERVKQDWLISFGRVMVTSLKSYITSLGLDEESHAHAPLVKLFLTNLAKSHSQSRSNLSPTSGFNNVVFSKEGIMALCEYDEKEMLVNMLKRKRGDTTTTTTTKTTTIAIANPLDILLSLGVLIVCPPAQRTKFNQVEKGTSQGANSSEFYQRQRKDELQGDFGYILSCPGLLFPKGGSNAQVADFRAGLVSLLKKNNTGAGASSHSNVSTSGYGVSMGEGGATQNWFRNFVKMREAKSKSKTMANPDSKFSIGEQFIVRDAVSRGLACIRNRGGQGKEYLKLVL